MVSRPGRSITAALGIALGIATVLSVQVVDHNTIRTEAARRNPATGNFDVTLRALNPGVPEGGCVPTALAGESALLELAAELQERVILECGAPGEERSVECRAAALGPLTDATMGRAAISVGREPDLSGAAEIALAPRIAEELHVQVGDTVTLRAAGRVQQGCVDGEMRWIREEPPNGGRVALRVTGLLELARIDRTREVVVPLDAVAPAFSASPVQVHYHGKLVEGAIYQDLRDRLQGRFLVEPVKRAMVGERVDQRAFRKSLRVTSGLALLLGLFVVYNAFSMALAERIRDLGLLRALGMDRRSMFATVFLEGLLLSLAGSAAGVVLSVGVVLAMERAGITTLGYGKPLEIDSVPWGSVLLVLSLGIATALFGMALPLARSRRLSVIEALRGVSETTAALGQRSRLALLVLAPVSVPFLYWTLTPPLGERQWRVLGWVAGIAATVAILVALLVVWQRPVVAVVRMLGSALVRVAPVTGTLARAALTGSRRRALATVAGLTVVVSSIVVVRAVNQGHLEEMRRFCERAVDGRVFLRFKEPVDLAAIRERLADSPGVGPAYALGAEVQTPFPLRGADAEAVASAFPEWFEDAEFSRSFRTGRSVIVSKFLADSFGLSIGDTVRVPTFRGPVELEIGAVHDEFGYFPDDRAFALLEESRMQQLWCVGPSACRNFAAPLVGGRTRAAVERDLEARLSGLPIQWVSSDRTLTENYLLDRRRDFLVFDVILVLLALLASVAVVNSLWIGLLERRQELAVLRTVGLTARQVARLVFFEAAILGATAAVLATPTALILSTLALGAVAVVGQLDLGLLPSIAALFLPAGIALVLAGTSGILPALRSKRIDLAATARYE